MGRALNKLCSLLDGAPGLDSKYGRIFWKRRNIPIIGSFLFTPFSLVQNRWHLRVKRGCCIGLAKVPLSQYPPIQAVWDINQCFVGPSASSACVSLVWEYGWTELVMSIGQFLPPSVIIL